MDILDAWMTVIARDGWANARIDAVATTAGVSAGAVADVAADRWEALRGYGRRLDHAALAEAGADSGASVRDRLFTLLMERFDAAQPQRLGAIELARAARGDPGLAAFMALSLPVSIARIADAAGVATGGLLGPLRVQALTIVYLAVARVWLGDDSPDLAATMKELDTRLAQAETWARRMPYRAAAVVPDPAIPLLAAPRSTVGRPAE
jgi:ubiquinone biosynthesis protein COQ9